MSSSTQARYELFITPLPLDFAYGRGQAALSGLLERFGTIARAEIRNDGWHAFALVEFHSELDALQTIYEVHGSFVCSRKVSVSWSEASLKSFRMRYDIRVEQHPWTLDKSWLTSLFARYGPTLIDVVDNPITTSSTAFAYVHFAQAEAAQRAIDERDGIVLGGAEVSVTWQGTLSRPGKELTVRFLPFDVSIRTVRDVFSGYGRLTNVDIARDRLSGEKIGIAYVQFLHELEAEQAIDALDGHVMSRGPIRITWARASRPSGHLIRVCDLAEIVDRKMLKPVFRRYGRLRCVEVDYDGLTGRSTREARVTFAGPEQVQAVLKYFGGYYLRNGEAVVSLPMDRLNRELERPAAPRILPPADSSASILAGAALPDLLTDSVIHVTANADRLSCELKRTATAGTASVSAASDSASPKTAISDLLTDSVIHVTAKMQPLDPSVDLIDLSNPSPPPMHSAVISPAEVGYIYAEKREYEIPVHFYAVTESEKLEIATQICSTGGNAEQDKSGAMTTSHANKNESDERYTKVTFVVRSTSELVEATRRINAAGMDCFTCVDPSIRGGHSFHRSEFMTVNVTIAPVCGKIKFSQHVVFLSPIDDPEDMGAAMDVMMLERTDVNLVSVLFDESDDDERHQVSLMLNLLR